MHPETIGGQGLLAVVEELAGVTGGLSELVDLANLERKRKAELVSLIRALQSSLGQQVRLEVRRWGGILRDVSAAYLGREGNLVTLDWGGNATSHALNRLEPRLFSAVVSDTTMRLLSSLSERVEETNRLRKPEIRARVAQVSGGPLGLGRTEYRLSLMNSGGGARDLRVTIRTKKMAHGYGPLKLGRSREIQLDLRKLRDMESTDTLQVELGCKDVGRRRFVGGTKVDPRSPTWHEIDLSMVQISEAKRRARESPVSSPGKR